MKFTWEDDRSFIPVNCKSGVYLVYKINCIAQFSFGKNNTYETAMEANHAANGYLNNRKDKEKLKIHLIRQ